MRMHRQKPYLPKEDVNCRVRCQGNLHRITLTTTGALVLHNHRSKAATIFGFMRKGERDRCAEVMTEMRRRFRRPSKLPTAFREWVERINRARERRRRDARTNKPFYTDERPFTQLGQWEIHRRFRDRIDKALDGFIKYWEPVIAAALPAAREVHLDVNSHTASDSYHRTLGFFTSSRTSRPWEWDEQANHYVQATTDSVYITCDPTFSNRYVRRVLIGNFVHVEDPNGHRAVVMDCDDRYGAPTRMAIVGIAAVRDAEPYLVVTCHHALIDPKAQRILVLHPEPSDAHVDTYDQTTVPSTIWEAHR